MLKNEKVKYLEHLNYNPKPNCNLIQCEIEFSKNKQNKGIEIIFKTITYSFYPYIESFIMYMKNCT